MQPSETAIRQLEIVNQLNWDSDMDQIWDLITNSGTDLGVILKIYWLGSPDYFAKNGVKNPDDENYQIIKTIREHVQTGFYKQATLNYSNLPKGIELAEVDEYNKHNQQDPIPAFMYTTKAALDIKHKT